MLLDRLSNTDLIGCETEDIFDIFKAAGDSLKSQKVLHGSTEVANDINEELTKH